MKKGLDFDAQALCSRKLWDIVNSAGAENTAATALDAAVEELALRRHYLSELEAMGKFSASKH